VRVWVHIYILFHSSNHQIKKMGGWYPKIPSLSWTLIKNDPPLMFSIRKGAGGILTAVNMKLTDFLQ
jgi:hypothetical protein